MEELSKAVVSRHPKVTRTCSGFLLIMIFMTEGVTATYYKPRPPHKCFILSPGGFWAEMLVFSCSETSSIRS